jgi:hypothetical protein
MAIITGEMSARQIRTRYGKSWRLCRGAAVPTVKAGCLKLDGILSIFANSLVTPKAHFSGTTFSALATSKTAVAGARIGSPIERAIF